MEAFRRGCGQRRIIFNRCHMLKSIAFFAVVVVVAVVVAVSYRAQLPCLLCEMRRKTGQNMCLHRSCVYRDELLTHLLRVCC